MKERIATGFDFEPLPDGNVLIEFYGDDGKTFNKQVITPDVLKDMALRRRADLGRPPQRKRGRHGGRAVVSQAK